MNISFRHISNKLHILIIAVMILLSSCASAPEEAGPLNISNISLGVLKISGIIEQSNKAQFLNALNSNVKKIVLTSRGGDVEASIDIALKIRSLNIEVEIDELCMSSCFNYIFLAAHKRSIRDSGFLGYHGAVENSLPPLVDTLFATPLDREKQFLNIMGFKPGFYDAIYDYAEKNYGEQTSDVDMLLIGPKFFEIHGLALNMVWFPKSQNEVNELALKISRKYGKALKLLGVYL